MCLVYPHKTDYQEGYLYLALHISIPVLFCLLLNNNNIQLILHKLILTKQKPINGYTVVGSNLREGFLLPLKTRTSQKGTIRQTLRRKALTINVDSAFKRKI